MLSRKQNSIEVKRKTLLERYLDNKIAEDMYIKMDKQFADDLGIVAKRLSELRAQQNNINDKKRKLEELKQYLSDLSVKKELIGEKLIAYFLGEIRVYEDNKLDIILNLKDSKRETIYIEETPFLFVPNVTDTIHNRTR